LRWVLNVCVNSLLLKNGEDVPFLSKADDPKVGDQKARLLQYGNITKSDACDALHIVRKV
jgi:hypothetical protein